MQRQIADPVQDEGGDRYLNVGALRVHHRHVSKGVTKASNCRLCSEGLESVINTLEEISTPDGTVELVSGDGTDEGGDPAPSSDSRDSGPPEGELLGDERRVRDSEVRETFR